MKDPIVEEIRKGRDEHARKFNYELGAIVKDFEKRQHTCGHKVVRFEPKKLKEPATST